VTGKSSKSAWRRRQARDPYVRRAQAEGWRSRAVFKLEEIDKRDRLFQGGHVVVDLGAAPGGWSQYAARRAGAKGQVIALDLLEMPSIPGVTCIQGDFRDEVVMENLIATLDGQHADLVWSDMAPNISGNRAVDQPRAMYLAELALDTARRILRPGGHFVVKVFQGEGFEEFLKDTRSSFSTVKMRKPKASRSESREMYLVARKYSL
jgi:23S rRNA (uridine2552-2'-O)-methyltransferase